MAQINKENEAAVPQKVLHELLDYDRLTGSWTNKVHRSPTARAGQPAGYVNKNGYVVIGINGRDYQAHRLAWAYVYGDFPEGEQPFIDHINGKRDDNRIANLKVSSDGDNSRNKKMYSRNTSGVTGVTRVDVVRPSGKIHCYWIARWCDENGKKRYKHFPINTYGESEAKQTAIDYRAEQLHLLEANFGIKYSERHGT